MILNALEDKPLPVYGDALNIRDWLHVEDHCVATDLVVHDGVSGEVYNIGGHNERTNLEIVRTILRNLGKSESLIQFVPDRSLTMGTSLYVRNWNRADNCLVH